MGEAVIAFFVAAVLLIAWVAFVSSESHSASTRQAREAIKFPGGGFLISNKAAWGCLAVLVDDSRKCFAMRTSKDKTAQLYAMPDLVGYSIYMNGEERGVDVLVAAARAKTPISSLELRIRVDDDNHPLWRLVFVGPGAETWADGSSENMTNEIRKMINLLDYIKAEQPSLVGDRWVPDASGSAQWIQAEEPPEPKAEAEKPRAPRKLIRLTCKGCGGVSFKKDDELFLCEHCGSSYVWSS